VEFREADDIGDSAIREELEASKPDDPYYTSAVIER
jgi:hypothetical protein